MVRGLFSTTNNVKYSIKGFGDIYDCLIPDFLGKRTQQKQRIENFKRGHSSTHGS